MSTSEAKASYQLGAVSHVLGLSLALAAAVLWGLNGVAAQDLFQRHGVDPRWLVTMRMVGGGFVLLAVFRPGWPRRHLRWLCLWAVLGLAAAQYTWLAAISLSNVATATFIQYLYVALTAAWQMMRGEVRRMPVRLAAVAAAGTGVALVILGQRGAVAGLQVSVLGIVFALSAVMILAHAGRFTPG